MVAAAVIGGSVLSAGASVIGSSNAADAQTSAANTASAEQKAQYTQTRSDLLPYNIEGQSTGNALAYGLGTGGTANGSGVGAGSLTAPVSMTEANVQATPGYQFNLNQGLKAVQNSAASRGLGVSGAALKGAASYATGLADSTYQNQFNNAVTNQTNNYNRLMGATTLGENAGATTGAYGTQTATNIGNNLVGAGNANAAADIAGGNAVGGIGNSALNGYYTNRLLSGATFASASGGGLFQPGTIGSATYQNPF